jgi:hypothetical protein
MGILTLNYNKEKNFGNFVVFFCFNSIFVIGRYGWLLKKIRPIFLITVNFLFIYKQFFQLFLSMFTDMLIGVCFKWFFELEMKGLGFKTFFSHEEEMYKVDIGFNHYIYCPIDVNTLSIKTKKRSRFIIVYGIDRLNVYDLVCKILLLRPLTSYKFRGIKLRHEPLKLKVGKKKQFF